MFAVATPQTVLVPDSVSITFRTDPGDVSKCFMDVMVEGGDIHTVQFHVRGGLIDHTFHPSTDDTIEAGELLGPVPAAPVVFPESMEQPDG